MATIQRIPVVWTGVTGLPGVSIFFGVNAGTANADLKTFFGAIKAAFPTGLSWAIPGAGDTLDSTTGGLVGTWSNAGGAGSVLATGPGAHAAGTGAYVNWHTSTVLGRRRVMGRTFLAPMSFDSYDAQGTIVAVTLSTLQAAATALQTAGQTIVWARPRVGGGSAAVTPSAAVVPDQVTSLRSRRR